ncbi:hypothetical protein Mgra_00000402 [Meloidogyne graminicola]|uniref:39S ribosomal protein L1, mitochondrial n=1 Tax=Meloidogyne graminicola TaxID=189291 RepID=A0A8T0A330_9BILA|nr:hypothetical protein Mgra_00000402 [Meloidogyne graminicola]
MFFGQFSSFPILYRSSTCFTSLLNPLNGANLEIIQIRGRKRGRRQLSKAERLARLQQREKREAERLEEKQKRLLEKLKKTKFATMWPPRYDAEAEKDLPEASQFNIILKNEVKTIFHTVSEALELHRNLQSPSIYGNVDAPIKLRMELNMSTEKATKLIGPSRQLIAIPFPFKHQEKRAIIAFAPDKPLQDEALIAGADLALGPDSVKKILKGQFLIEDYDFCVAHESVAKEILPLRGILKSRFPNKINGAIGTDLPAILAKFLSGANLVVKPDSAYAEWGLAEPVVGRLDMPDEEIEANIITIISTLCQQRNPALGPYINRASLMTLPASKTFYSIDVSEWLPIPTEQELRKVEKKPKKKVKKEDEDEKKLEEMAPWRSDPLLNLM